MTSERIPVEQAKYPLFAGVDVGGTNIKIGVVDDNGQTIGLTSLSTREELGVESAMHRTRDTLVTLLEGIGLTLDDVAFVGLGSPGSMDIPNGMILEPPNMPSWRDFPIRDCLSDACGKPVSFANDANAAAYGEFWVGTGRQFKSLVMFTLGTGVGGGIILDGVSLDGEHSFGSELGHLIIDQSPEARLCVWGGGRGQLEAYASAPAVAARATEALAAGRQSSVQARVDRGEPLTPLMLFEEAEKGDEFSLEIILETARCLGVGVTSVVHTIDPGAVVIGGAMTFGRDEVSTGRRFLARVREEFRSRCFGVVRDSVVIDYASLGGAAGYLGAAGIAREAFRRREQTPSRVPIRPI
jgi:glucokinase